MLNALSPLDGRYAQKIDGLRMYFSEQALMQRRVLIEIEWLVFLSHEKSIPEVRAFTKEEVVFLHNIAADFSEEDGQKIKGIERITNHDVKAVEYFLKEKLEQSSLADVTSWLHFSCTSEDINNLAYALMLRDGVNENLLPQLHLVLEQLTERSTSWKDVGMLARTHGQPASPTTMGKAWLNFVTRLRRQIKIFEDQQYLGKFNGATGNFNAHVAAFPQADWLTLSEKFVTGLGLTWQPVSDQIEPHDFIAEICHACSRINTILIDFARDIWGYIALNYFGQKVIKGEVGSSTMPHKVNPIDFENAEGNLGLANALFAFFAEKLPISRWQRDLTDSTVSRNLGVAFGHMVLALESLKKGVGKLELRSEVLIHDLENNWEVLGEAVQTVLRKHGVQNAYEQLKELTRGKRLTPEAYADFIKGLDLPETEKTALLHLTPQTYTGLAAEIVSKFS